MEKNSVSNDWQTDGRRLDEEEKEEEEKIFISLKNIRNPWFQNYATLWDMNERMIVVIGRPLCDTSVKAYMNRSQSRAVELALMSRVRT